MPDVTVVGGGTIGLSIAWRCSQRGLSVTVIDEVPGSGASAVAAGMLAPVTEVHYGEEELLRLNIASSELFPAFATELEEVSALRCGYEPCGTLIVARDADDDAELDHIYDFQRGLGLKVERLRGRESRELEPGLAPRTRGGILAPDDHRVDPAALNRALRRACEAGGVAFLLERAEKVESRRVATPSQILDSDAVVIAAGVHSTSIEMPPEIAVPVRPVKGQVVELRGSDPLTRHNVRGLEGYIVSRSDGRAVIGATMEEKGFDLTVTAEAMYELLRAAFELVPGALELEFTGGRAGLRPATPDNAPLLGRTQVDGVVLATGHFRNGILLAPITADGITNVIVNGDDERLAPFDPDRFEAAS